MYETMLIPLDGSQVAEEILPYAAELAKRCGSRVTLIQVVESVSQAVAVMTPAAPLMVTPTAVENVVDGVHTLEDSAKTYLTRCAEKLGSDGLSVAILVASGSPGNEIAQYARAEGIGLIAMTSHGRGGVGRAIFGSVADHVVRHVDVPVLITRAKTKE